MTAKRFNYVIDNGNDTIYDLSDNGGILENFMDIEETMNELYEENKELKKEIQDCRDYNAKIYSDVAQNEIILSRENKELQHSFNELLKENKELKSDLQYWRTLSQSLAKGNNIGKFEMRDKEVTIDLNELDINIKKEIIFKSDLNKWIEKKMDYYERMMEKTDGYNNVGAKGHLDMLILLKEWIKQR